MKRIAYYISDYGFGHATRSAAIIQELLKQDRDISIIICNSYAVEYLEKLLPDDRIKFRCIKTDVGYFLQEDSIEPDAKRLNKEYDQYIKSWPALIKEEWRFLKEEEVDLVLSDISPIAFEAAYQAGVPSGGISNFTWHTAYDGLIDSLKLEPFRLAYEKMSIHFRLAASREPAWGISQEYEYGFISREIDDWEVKRIRKAVNPINDHHIIFFGLGMKMNMQDLSKLKIWESPNCKFIVSSNTSIQRPNITKIPKDYIHSHNYIAAADLVITKAGWGTVGEAVAAHTPLLIIDRQTMREDHNTITFLKKHRLCHTVTWEELKNLTITDSLMNCLKSCIDKENNKINYQEKMADDIINILESES
ncbi:glycosyltransferase [Peribacillus kribbensis]|uniref:glycosyltransferase n=1 Tax=Peribacillus kribbensis TaxID=356658 RepID=UPI00040196FC|nr:glycosyltransferase [Peribacillus kribbensis]